MIDVFCRYVDIAEAIDSADPSFLDNSEFQEADAIPVHDTLPIKHYLVHEVSAIFYSFSIHIESYMFFYSFLYVIFSRMTVKKFVPGFSLLLLIRP